MGIKTGQVIDDKYEIVRLIGEGGMGAVYEGRNRFISRTVAIKVLLPAAIEADPSAIQRFEREAQAAGRIGSDHILEVIDLGSLASGERYMVMEYLDGETLAGRIRRLGRLAPRELHPLLVQALQGLSAAHRAGIVHRDLKPDNLFILREKAGTPDFVKLIDFGISKFADAASSELSMTRTGALMGTPYYMSPEQAKGAEGVNHQTDLYSLGVIAFEAVTGHVPYDADTFNDLMFKIVLSETPDPERLVGGLDPAFCAIVRRAMERDLRKRFATAEDFLAALERWSPMAATVADGTPMSVQGAGLIGDFGLETITHDSGLIASRLTVGQVEPAQGERPRQPPRGDESAGAVSDHTAAQQVSLAATSVADPLIPSTNARPPGTTTPIPSAEQRIPSTSGPAAGPRPAAPDPQEATVASPGPAPRPDQERARPGKEPRKITQPIGSTLASPEGSTPAEERDAPTERLPLSRGPRPHIVVPLLVAAAVLGLLLLGRGATDDPSTPPPTPETAALKLTPPPPEVPPLDLSPHPRVAEVRAPGLVPEDPGAALTETPTETRAVTTPPEPSGSSAAARPAPPKKPATVARPKPAPTSPPGLEPTPAPSQASSGSFAPESTPTRSTAPAPGPAPRDFGY